MSRLGLFLTLPIDTIVSIQTKAVNMLLEGKTVMSWQGEGVSATKSFAMPVSDVLEECDWALRSLDPSTYGNIRILAKPYHL